MRLSPKSLPSRALDAAHESAGGSPVPAGQEPPPGGASAPGALERAAMRRRLRRLVRMREVHVAELGALVVEMNRLGRRNEQLLERKAGEVRALDDEAEGLRRALGTQATVEQVVAAGIAGSCTGCGTILGTDDRFCSRCGRPVVARRTAAAPAAAQRPAAPTAATAPAPQAPPPPPAGSGPPPPPPPAEPSEAEPTAAAARRE